MSPVINVSKTQTFTKKTKAKDALKQGLFFFLSPIYQTLSVIANHFWSVWLFPSCCFPLLTSFTFPNFYLSFSSFSFPCSLSPSRVVERPFLLQATETHYHTLLLWWGENLDFVFQFTPLCKLNHLRGNQNKENCFSIYIKKGLWMIFVSLGCETSVPLTPVLVFVSGFEPV